MAHPQIAAFARLAKENSRPTRLIAGQKTLLSRTMHDIHYDEVHDEILVTNPFAQAVLVFRGAANGEEKPLRVIQGPHTRLSPGGGRLEVDTIHNEIFVPQSNQILVFPRTGNGDIPPIRVLQGPATQFDRHRVGAVAVDPVHNLIVATTLTRAREGGLSIFNRTDNGDVAPQAMIFGPKTRLTWQGQLDLNPPKGWIIVSHQGPDPSNPEPPDVFVGVWSIHDSGDVPPRWTIGGPKSTLKKPRGIALDPKHKEVIVADMTLNAVLTYYFPEIF